MPNSSPTVQRSLKHARAIRIDAYAREDGLWDLDAHITDHKTRDFQLASGARPVGAAIHDLQLCVTIDVQFNIIDVSARSVAVPYPGYCEAIEADYQKLIGLNLLRQFRQQVKQRMAGSLGCTHLTELAQILPTAAIQAFAGEVVPTHDGANAHEAQTQPFQLERCHALRLDAPAVAKFYPRWAKTKSNLNPPS